MAGVPASSHGSSGIGDVAVTGTPQSGYTVVASSASAAAWAAPSAGALTLLSTTTVTGSAATIDVTGISQLYNDLTMILIAAGSSVGASSDALLMRLNNDSGSTYSGNLIRANGASVGGVQTIDGTSWRVSESMAAQGGSPLANSFSMWVVDLMGYASTTWVKQVSSRAANAPRTSFPRYSPVFG
jgi:hypothetical protein